MKETAAQKRARIKYQARTKGKYKTISITQAAEQTDADRALLKEKDLTPVKVWRDAMQRLKGD